MAGLQAKLGPTDSECFKRGGIGTHASGRWRNFDLLAN
jgi:hypothetical protein